MADNLTYLDTYLLQKDMRIRLPKAILANANAKKGETEFDIFYCADEDAIILKVHKDTMEDQNG